MYNIMGVENSNMVQHWSTHTTVSLIEGLNKGLWDRILEYQESKLDKYCIQENIRPCFIFTHFESVGKFYFSLYSNITQSCLVK